MFIFLWPLWLLNLPFKIWRWLEEPFPEEPGVPCFFDLPEEKA